MCVDNNSFSKYRLTDVTADVTRYVMEMKEFANRHIIIMFEQQQQQF